MEILGKKDIPFHFELSNKNQILYYFGSNHSRNPEDQQYIQLKSYWTKFINKVKNESAVVLIEGGLRKLRSTADEAI